MKINVFCNFKDEAKQCASVGNYLQETKYLYSPKTVSRSGKYQAIRKVHLVPNL